MSIQDLGSIGEFIAAIATLFTLGYLALQIRQNTKTLRSQARRQVLEGIRSDTERFINFNAVSKFSKVNSGAELTEQEIGEISVMFLSFAANLEIQFFELQEGTLEPEFEETLKYRLFTLLEGNGLREFWNLNKLFFTKEFQRYVEELLENGFGDEYERPIWTNANVDT